MAPCVPDLEALRRRWQHEPRIVAGHSFGAELALAYAVEHPTRTIAVIFVSCVLTLAGHSDRYAEYRENRLARLSDVPRERFLELRLARDNAIGAELEAIQREYRELAGVTYFGDPVRAEHLLHVLSGLEKPVNQEVNRVLAADFEARFDGPLLSNGCCKCGCLRS